MRSSWENFLPSVTTVMRKKCILEQFSEKEGRKKGGREGSKSSQQMKEFLDIANESGRARLRNFFTASVCTALIQSGLGYQREKYTIANK